MSWSLKKWNCFVYTLFIQGRLTAKALQVLEFISVLSIILSNLKHIIKVSTANNSLYRDKKESLKNSAYIYL